MMMTVGEIKSVACLDMVEYPDAVDRKRNGLDQYYINFSLEDGGFGSFDKSQDDESEVMVNY